jgi:hypothetical protein
MPTTHLSAKNVRTLERIYQHPVSHNLEWHDVIALIEHLGTVKEESNGHLTLTVKGESKVFHRSHGKDISEIQQVLDLRHFLESAQVGNKGPIKPHSELKFLAVVTQQETRVFRLGGTEPLHIRPDEPTYLRHLQHTEGGDVAARSPESMVYYEAIAQALMGTDEILLMGNGTGASSAMLHLKDYLETHHAALARLVVGSVMVDVESLTNGELLAQARLFFQKGPIDAHHEP